jgi:hypothetical protein
MQVGSLGATEERRAATARPLRALQPFTPDALRLPTLSHVPHLLRPVATLGVPLGFNPALVAIPTERTDWYAATCATSVSALLARLLLHRPPVFQALDLTGDALSFPAFPRLCRLALPGCLALCLQRLPVLGQLLQALGALALHLPVGLTADLLGRAH